MIGVVSRESEEEIVREFFELFKVPWEFYKENRRYSVIISTQGNVNESDIKLLVLYDSEKIKFDIENNIKVSSQKDKGLLQYEKIQMPVYGKFSIFDTSANAAIKLESMAGQAVGVEINSDSRRTIRVGFDLFQEIRFLLTAGQPVEFSEIPTLDTHISILREWILESGLPLIEIPPIPAGYKFTSCLTHDIDFAGIRSHKFDHTVFGFLYRAFWGSLWDVLRNKGSWSKLYENWKAVLLLPAIYMGFAKDFWRPFDRYTEVEEGFHSTFFIIPFKNEAGTADENGKHARRATRYDVLDVKEEIKELLSRGCEIGVHGIDAWRNTQDARKEFEQIHEVTGKSGLGIRMHWLYFNDQSPQILEDAGFSYDSTLGYNEGIGYRSGTTQVYRPLGLQKLFELPMHIQDTALFFPDRMGLTEKEAWALIQRLLENARRYGGVLTINWHDRSLAPERLWGNFYINLLENLKNNAVWVDTASRVVRWFDKRRSASFEKISVSQDKVNLHIISNNDDDVPDLIMRIHLPQNRKRAGADFETVQNSHLDISFKDVLNAEFPLQ